MAEETTRLRLIAAEDAAELARLARANADHLRPWDPARTPDFYTEPRQAELIRSALEDYRSGVSAPFVIESGEEEILGRLTLSGVVLGALRSCALSYWIRADRLRRGHATRAAALGVAHAFGGLGLHRVQAETLPENVASQRVLRAVGFTLFGAAPKYLRINGAWRDHLMFQLLNPECE